jgi:ferredoxin-NADP reductase
LLQLKKDDELILHEVFGAISYKGEGVFIAGGAGVTPFISIFRYLHSKKEIGNNKLIFANKTKADIIHEKEFKKLLGTNFINILSDEKVEGYANGLITEKFIKTNCDGINKLFYVCGPPPMMDAIEKALTNLQVNEKSIIKETF